MTVLSVMLIPTSPLATKGDVLPVINLFASGANDLVPSAVYNAVMPLPKTGTRLSFSSVDVYESTGIL